MTLPIDTSQTPNNQTDVSRNALSIARRIDRLAPGQYTITIKKPEEKGAGWTFQIDQPVTIQKGEIGKDKPTSQIIELGKE